MNPIGVFLLLSLWMVPAWALNQSMTLGTNYIKKGESQTKDSLALQYQIEHQLENGFYSGLWASNVKPADTMGIELNFYMGQSVNLNSVLSLYGHLKADQYLLLKDQREDTFLTLGGIGHWDWGQITAMLEYDFNTESIIFKTHFHQKLPESFSWHGAAEYAEPAVAGALPVQIISFGVQQELPDKNLRFGADMTRNQTTTTSYLVLFVRRDF